VELAVEQSRVATGGGMFGALVEGGAKRFEISIGGAERGQPRRLRLHEQARLQQLSEGDAAEAEERLEVAHERARVDFADEVSARRTLPHLDEAAMLEGAQRFAHGDAAGGELAHQLALRRQLVALLQPALVDRTLDLRDDVLVHARRSH
jgi:hypothetical protein